MKKLLTLLFLTVIATPSFEAGDRVSVKELKSKLDKYAQVPLKADTSHLPDSERQALGKLIEAARAIDEVYWKQRTPQGLALRESLARSRSAVDKLFLRYLKINYGPYDKSDEDRPFIGTQPFPAGGTFYPEDLKKEELESYIAAHPEVKEEFEKINTVIRRKGDELIAVPFEQLYRSELERAAIALRQAAALTGDASLKRFLELRAGALVLGNYRESDFAWIDVRSSPLDIIIGPIESYEDRLMGIKTSYECSVLVRDVEASNRLKVFEQEMALLQNKLPVPDDLQPREMETSTPIGIFQVAYAAGASNAGVKSIASSLPNDEVVIKEKGAKKLFYKNVILAKFNKILTPIARLMLDPSLLKQVSEEGFFNNVLGHELAHTLGLKFVRKDGKETDTSIRLALKETYSTIEEAKADIVGIYAIGHFRARGILSARQERECYASYLASTFRSVRFGSSDDHARANILQFNHLLRTGGIIYNAKTHKFGIDQDRFVEGVKTLSEKLLTIEGRGDYEAAKALIEQDGKLDARTEAALRRLSAIPVDVEFVQ